MTAIKAYTHVLEEPLRIVLPSPIVDEREDMRTTCIAAAGITERVLSAETSWA